VATVQVNIADQQINVASWDHSNHDH